MGIERKYFQNKGNNTSIYMITFELFTQTKETDWIGRESSSMYYSLQLGPYLFQQFTEIMSGMLLLRMAKLS